MSDLYYSTNPTVRTTCSNREWWNSLTPKQRQKIQFSNRCKNLVEKLHQAHASELLNGLTIKGADGYTISTKQRLKVSKRIKELLSKEGIKPTDEEYKVVFFNLSIKLTYPSYVFRPKFKVPKWILE